MALLDEVNEKRREIRTDGYAMSIGEWASLYENKEIPILRRSFGRLLGPFQRSFESPDRVQRSGHARCYRGAGPRVDGAG